MTIEYTLIGHGPTKVVAAHTWLCGHQSYAPMVPFFDTDRFTFAFPDFRGFGKSNCFAEDSRAGSLGAWAIKRLFLSCVIRTGTTSNFLKRLR